MDGVFLVAFPFFVLLPLCRCPAEEKMKRRDRWQDGEKERVNETDDGRETRKERAAFVVFFLFFIPVSDGRGRNE